MSAAWIAAGLALVALAGDATAGADGVEPFGLGGFGREEPVSIRADRLIAQERGAARRLAFRDGVQVRQGPLELHASVVEARYPIGSQQPDQLWARGDVRIREGERRALCDEAHYDRPAQRIVCRGEPAELWDGGDRLSGGEVVFDLERRSVHVSSGAELEIQRERLEAGAGVPNEWLERLDADAPLTIHAERLDASDRDDARHVAFAGGVIVRQGVLEMHSRSLEAAYLARATKPDRLIARDDVVIRDGSGEARCALAEYRPADRRLSCEGEARLHVADEAAAAALPAVGADAP